jgi:hypothetical protein
VALLAGCVMVPTAPMVVVLPGSTKPLDQFRADDDYCRGYAYASVAGPTQAATNTAAANAAVGTALGAAAGALIGSASGNAGSGAAIGAGTGLLFGSAAGANALGYSYYALQHQYDAAFVQCMYAHGNKVPARFYRGGMQDYPVQRYSVPGSSPEGAPAAGYPPPNPSPDSIPPPNTPPPRI